MICLQNLDSGGYKVFCILIAQFSGWAGASGGESKYSQLKTPANSGYLFWIFLTVFKAVIKLDELKSPDIIPITTLSAGNPFLITLSYVSKSKHP